MKKYKYIMIGVMKLNLSSIHENMQRGTPDFPIELYSVSHDNPRYFMQMHWHKDFEMIRVSEGQFYLTLNGRRFVLEKGQSAVIPGGIVHGGEPKKCRYECLVFSAGILYAVQKCRKLVKTYMQAPEVFEKNEDIDALFRIFSEQKQGYELLAIGLIYKIAGKMVQSEPNALVLPDERMEKIKAAISLIEENYSRKISLAELASVCRMSPNYFSRFFKEMTKQTPFEYIITYRIEAACEMLSDGTSSVTEACYSCGFNDLSYFIHIFKKYKGMSPKAYLKRR